MCGKILQLQSDLQSEKKWRQENEKTEKIKRGDRKKKEKTQLKPLATGGGKTTCFGGKGVEL